MHAQTRCCEVRKKGERPLNVTEVSFDGGAEGGGETCCRASAWGARRSGKMQYLSRMGQTRDRR